MKLFSISNNFVPGQGGLPEMPYYKIIITLKDGRVQQGIRQLDIRNIDVAYNFILAKAGNYYRQHDIRQVDVYMVSKNSAEVKRRRR